MDDTEKLCLAVYSESIEKSLFPKEFISAIRNCLDVGITAKQLSKIVLLSSCVIQLDNIDLEELLGRTLEVSHVMVNLKTHQSKKKESKVI